MIHFFDASNEKMAAKVPDMAKQADILLGNLEDAVPVDRKMPAREGLIRVGKEVDFGDTQLWTRVNSLDSPWVLDDLTQLVTEIGDKLDVIMVPKVEGAWDIHYVDRLLAQLEAKAGLDRPLLVHAILETAQGVVERRGDRHRQPAHAGHELRPGRPRRLAPHEDDPRRRRPPRLPGDRGPGSGKPRGAARDRPAGPRGTTRSRAWSTPAPATGILPFYGPFGDIKDDEGCETQFRAAFLLGCVGAWSLHPRPDRRSPRRSSPPPPTRSSSQRRCSRRFRTARGVHMIDGKMQDDATWKQCKVMVSSPRCSPRRTPSWRRRTGSWPQRRE